MNIQITPFSNATTLTKTSVKPRTANKNLLVTPKVKLNQPSINKSRFSLELTSNTIQPMEIRTLNNKKGILLYQNIERDNLFSNNVELVNRFHYKI